MKKGFTLIELLAVIVILAIIALIATPIILGIINDAKKQSNLRSAEMYVRTVELAIARKSLTTEIKNTTCEVIESSGNLNCTGLEEDVSVDMDGTKPISGTIVIENGKIKSVSNLKIGGETYETNSNNVLVAINNTGEHSTNQPIVPDVEEDDDDEYICELEDGSSQTKGASYSCELDDTRIFYVLGTNSNDSNKIDLIMDRNYTSNDVPSTMDWCISDTLGCNHNNLDIYIEIIEEEFQNINSNITVSLPSYSLIYNVNGSEDLRSTPWLYNFSSYWTSTLDNDDDDHIWIVGNDGFLNNGGQIHSNCGIRPIITISKNLLN